MSCANTFPARLHLGRLVALFVYLPNIRDLPPSPRLSDRWLSHLQRSIRASYDRQIDDLEPKAGPAYAVTRTFVADLLQPTGLDWVFVRYLTAV